MSEQPHEPRSDDDAEPHVPVAEAPLDERPAVAGGTDDGPPVQGEGAPDSW